MNKETKITISNLVYSLLFLVLGIILLTSTEDLITIVSRVIGAVLCIIGLVNSISYIYMKGKLGQYNVGKLIVGLAFISFGILLILFSSALSFAIRTIVGVWIIFSAINRVIFAFSVKLIDKKGFLVYLITALVMFVLGAILIAGIFDELIGLLIIIYSIIEIVNYVYYKIKNKTPEENIPSTKLQKNNRKIKKYKKGKVVDAIIDEEEKDV